MCRNRYDRLSGEEALISSCISPLLQMRVDPSSWQVVTPETQRTTLSRSPTTSQALSADARIQTVLRVLGMRSLRLTANAGFTVYDDGQWPDSSVREGGPRPPWSRQHCPIGTCLGAGPPSVKPVLGVVPAPESSTQ